MTTHLTDTQKTQIRIALAKHEGFDVANFFTDDAGVIFTIDEWENIVEAPNYPESLEDCHAIEVKLTDEEHGRFRVFLCGMIGTEGNADDERNYISASAEHRSLALYRSLNLGELGD